MNVNFHLVLLFLKTSLHSRAVVTMPTNLETRQTFTLDVALSCAHYRSWIVSPSTINDQAVLIAAAFVWSGSQQSITSAPSLPVVVAVVFKRISSGAALCDCVRLLLCMKSGIVIVAHVRFFSLLLCKGTWCINAILF